MIFFLLKSDFHFFLLGKCREKMGLNGLLEPTPCVYVGQPLYSIKRFLPCPKEQISCLIKICWQAYCNVMDVGLGCQKGKDLYTLGSRGLKTKFILNGSACFTSTVVINTSLLCCVCLIRVRNKEIDINKPPIWSVIVTLIVHQLLKAVDTNGNISE